MDHSKLNLYSLIQWLIKNAIFYVRKHPFFSSSVAIHTVILYLLYSYGSYQVNLQEHQHAYAEVTQSLQKAQQTDMQKRIEDMEKIKRLLEKTINKSSEDMPAETSGDQLKSEQNSAPKTPAELLAKAKETLESIKAIEKNIKAEELAKLLNIPKDEALKKVEEKISAEQNKAKKPEQNEAQIVKQLEAEARTALEERKKELDAKNSGTKIELSKASQTTKQNKDDKNSSGNKGSNGDGEHGSANGAHGAGDGSFAQTSLTKDDIKNDASPTAEMADFLAESSYAMGNENNVFDPSRGHIPEVTGNERKQTGRIIGAGGNFAERVYLNSWYVIGPFKGNSNAALYNNPSYPPEQLVDLDAVYFGKDERILKWQYIASGEYPFVPPDRDEDAVYYGYTEIALDRAQDLWMWCGADDDMQVWLNQHLVWAGGNIAKQNFFDTIYPGTDHYRKNWNLTEGKRLVHFQQGNNKLLFKLSNGPNRFGIFASIVLTQ